MPGTINILHFKNLEKHLTHKNRKYLKQMPLLKQDQLLHFNQGPHTTENGKATSVTATVSSNGWMGPLMKANGKLIKPMVKESLFILTEMCMKEILEII